jgi:hypothetical protein
MAVQWGLLDTDMPAKVGGSVQQGQKNALAMQAAGQEQQMNALKLQQAQQEMGNKNALREAYRSSGGDTGKFLETLKGSGDYESAMKLQKGLSEQQKYEMEAKKAELENRIKKVEFISQILSSSHDQASHDANLSQLSQDIEPELMQNIPKVYNPQEMQFIIKRGESIKDQDYLKMRAIDQAQREQQLAQTATYQQAQLGLAGQAGQRQEQELGLKSQEAQRKANEPAKLENIPPAHRAAYMENEAALTKIDDAIEKIKTNPKALGMGNIAGEFVTQRTDPEGVATRAALAEISSQKRHELSGASITASESPVLAPFIPKATDDPTAAIDKLKSLKKHYLESNSQFESEYSKPDYKSPFPTKATERKAKIQLIDEIKKAQKETGFSLGAKGEKEMDLEKQDIENLKDIVHSIRQGGAGQENAITHPQYPGFSIRK